MPEKGPQLLDGAPVSRVNLLAASGMFLQTHGIVDGARRNWKTKGRAAVSLLLWQVGCGRFSCEEEYRAVQEEDDHKRPTKKTCCSRNYPEQQ